jgi:hypothetical protein
MFAEWATNLSRPVNMPCLRSAYFWNPTGRRRSDRARPVDFGPAILSSFARARSVTSRQTRSQSLKTNGSDMKYVVVVPECRLETRSTSYKDCRWRETVDWLMPIAITTSFTVLAPDSKICKIRSRCGSPKARKRRATGSIKFSGNGVAKALVNASIAMYAYRCNAGSKCYIFFLLLSE